MERTQVSATTFRIAFVLLLVIGVSVMFLAVAWPFLKPLLLGGLFGGLAAPLYGWVTRLLRGRKSLAAVLTLLLLFVVVAGPLSAFIGVVVKQAISVSNDAIPWVQQHLGSATAFDAHNWLVQRFPSLADYVPELETIADRPTRLAKSAGGVTVATPPHPAPVTVPCHCRFYVLLCHVLIFILAHAPLLDRTFY